MIEMVASASDADRPVELHLGSAHGQATLAVVDQGCGIPATALEQVRQPFFTLKARGTGLGLSICQQLLEANAARMELASTPGAGTVVTLDFPAPAATYLK